MKKAKLILKKIAGAIVFAAVLLITVFVIGRYGWKLFGFSVCESAGIEHVEVTDGQVRITGFYPGSFPRGFLGYHAEEKDGSLYVGFKFSGLFGIFETGDFDIAIPVKGEITEVIIKTKNYEYPIWPEAGSTQELPPETESVAAESGIYVLLERNDVYAIDLHFDHKISGMRNTDNTPLQAGACLYLDNQITWLANGWERPVPFMLTATDSTGQTIARANLLYDPASPVMFVTVTSEGEILVNGEKIQPPEIPSAYELLISQYQTALEEEWSGQQLVDAGLNYMIRDVLPETVGCAMEDLDSDGAPELIIGTTSGDEFYGKLIFNLYTLDENGDALQLFSSTERDRWYYAGGIRFANLGSSAWNDSFVTTLKLENKEMIDMTFTTDPADYVQMELVPLVEWSE